MSFQAELALLRNPDRLYLAFTVFDRQNPNVKARFDRHCTDLLAAGFTHYSADAICAAIRFDHDLSIQSVGDVDIEGRRLRLNNNHVTFYARRWLLEHPSYPLFFSLRTSSDASHIYPAPLL